MDSTLTVASRQSETLQRVGTTVMIFAISLFGMSCPLLAFLPCLVRLTGKEYSRIIPLYLCPHNPPFAPTYTLLRWQTLWNRRHPVHRLRPSSPRFLQIPQQSPRSGDIKNRGLDRAHSVNVFALRWAEMLTLDYSLTSLLTIFLIECMYSRPVRSIRRLPLSPDISSSYVSQLDPQHQHHHGHAHDLETSLPSHSAHSHDTCKRSSYTEPHERTPLVTSQTTTVQRSQTTSANGTVQTVQIFEGHHHFESRASHCTDGPVSPRVLPKLLCGTKDRQSHCAKVHSRRSEAEPNPYDSAEDDSTTVAGCSQDPSEQPDSEGPETPASSPRRQIVGILVSILQRTSSISLQSSPS